MPNNNLRILLAVISSLLLIASLFFPWWTASAQLPGGEARAELTLFTFHFESRSFDCTTALMFYAYGSCPLLDGEAGVAALSFYLFWSLVFLILSLGLQIVWLNLLLRGTARQAVWLPSVSPMLSIIGSFAFIAAISAAGLKFVTGSALYGSSEVLTWSVSVGFFLVAASILVQLAAAYIARRAV